MKTNDPLKELKRKEFYNDYKKLENNIQKGEKLNINGVDYGVESISACFNESVLELRLIHIGKPLKNIHKKRRFEIGDKVKLNQPMHHSMEKQIEYRKYYDVVATDIMECGGNEIQILGIDGVKGLISAEYFDLYIENDIENNKDEAKLNIGDFVILKDSDNRPSELNFNNIYEVEFIKNYPWGFVKLKGKKFYWRNYLFNKVNLENIKNNEKLIKLIESEFDMGELADFEVKFK